jgi:ABC-2 type transport system permease protein
MEAVMKGVRVFKNSGQVVTRITFRSILKGTIILGVLTGAMVMLQGMAYVAAYPDIKAQQQFAETLMASPALGILYGDPSYTTTARGYVVYRCLAFLMLVGSIWGLLTATRLFRGQEEDGRTEMLLSGQTTAGKAALRTMAGFGMAWGVAFALCASMVIITGHSKGVFISGQEALFFTLAILLPALFFFGLGAFTSQLAASRRRATLYGLVPLVIFYAMRCAAHVLKNAEWLQVWTPFGWIERAKPIIDSKPVWIVPTLAGAVLLAGAALWIASRRDLGESVIAESDIAPPRFAFLGSVRGLAFRLNSPVMFWWLLGTTMLAALMTALAKTAADAVEASGSIADALSTLTGGSTGIAIAFMSMSTFFIAVLLMVMATSSLAAIRHEEAKSYLDNILSRPIGRLQWLRDRLFVLAGGLFATYVAASLTALVLAKAQGIPIDGTDFLLQGLNMFGPISVVLGVGVLLYGWKPRLASMAMYIVISWSFLVDMVGSVVKFNKFIVNSSLVHHIALVPATQPDWSTFSWTLLVGLLLTALGLYSFARRDLEVE